jgi:hypothetical protein
MKDDRWPDFHHVAQCAAATSLTLKQPDQRSILGVWVLLGELIEQLVYDLLGHHAASCRVVRALTYSPRMISIMFDRLRRS